MRFLFTLLLTALPLLAQTNYVPSRTFGVLLTWSANAETDLAGYNVYYGTATTNYTVKLDRGLGNTTNGTVWCAITNLAKTADKYFFVVTAYNTSGLESDPSNEVSYDVPKSPTITIRSILQASKLPTGPWNNVAQNTNRLAGDELATMQFFRVRIDPPELEK